ncbi:hypothetical protein HDU76_004917, partial [Blyttiomyces sp. JEL0837]
MKWEKFMHIQLWLFYFAIVFGGGVTVYMTDVIRSAHLNGAFSPAMYPGKYSTLNAITDLE